MNRYPDDADCCRVIARRLGRRLSHRPDHGGEALFDLSQQPLPSRKDLPELRLDSLDGEAVVPLMHGAARSVRGTGPVVVASAALQVHQLRCGLPRRKLPAHLAIVVLTLFRRLRTLFRLDGWRLRSSYISRVQVCEQHEQAPRKGLRKPVPGSQSITQRPCEPEVLEVGVMARHRISGPTPTPRSRSNSTCAVDRSRCAHRPHGCHGARVLLRK
jgi:hypothetical protein